MIAKHAKHFLLMAVNSADRANSVNMGGTGGRAVRCPDDAVAAISGKPLYERCANQQLLAHRWDANIHTLPTKS